MRIYTHTNHDKFGMVEIRTKSGRKTTYDKVLFVDLTEGAYIIEFKKFVHCIPSDLIELKVGPA